MGAPRTYGSGGRFFEAVEEIEVEADVSKLIGRNRSTIVTVVDFFNQFSRIRSRGISFTSN